MNRYRPVMAVCAVLSILAAASCAPPYFADLDAAAPLTRQMTFLATVGPFGFSSSLASADVRFLPTKPDTAATALSVKSGFVARVEGGDLRVTFAYVDSSGSWQSDSDAGLPVTGSNPNYPLYDVVPTTSPVAATAYLLVLRMSPTDATTNQATLYRGSLSGSPISMVPVTSGNPESLNSVISGDSIVGAQAVPSPGLPDTFNFLAADAALTAGDAASSVDGVTNVIQTIATAPTLFFPLPAGVRRVFYGRNQGASLSYATYYLSGAWQCIRWTPPATPTPLPGMTHRLDAVLTDGDLLSAEGGTLRLYDSNGSQVLETGLGGLQFCYEAYVGTTPYVFFSLTMHNNHGDFTFNSYAMPTSALRSLKR